MLTYGSELLKRTVNTSFWNSFYGMRMPFDGLVWRNTDSDQDTETYARIGDPPRPTEWKGDRQYKVAPELTYTLTNVHWDASTVVDKKFVKYDRINEVGRHVGRMGEKARNNPAAEFSTVLEAGFSTAGDDGQFFFDTDHSDPGSEYTTSQDNDLTSSIVDKDNPTAAELVVIFRSIIAQFYTFKDGRGDPMVPTQDIGDPSLFVIMIPTSGTWLTSARRVLVTDTISAAGDNDLQGTFTLRPNPWLSNTDVCYGFYTGSNHAPLIEQTSGGIEIEDEKVYDSGHFKYSASYWGQYGYGQWRTAVGYTTTTT